MKTQILVVLALMMLQLLTGRAQTSSTPTPTSGPDYKLSPGAAEVEKLAQSSVGDDVVLSYIGQSQIYYNLSAADIVKLKSAGVSSQAMTAMLNHDSALHNQQLAANPAASAASSTPVASAPSASAPTAAAPSPASASTTAVVAAPTPAPAPQVEVVPVSPGPDYVWAPGYWSWNGGVWVWIGGYWHYPTRPGHVWIGGYWSGHRRGRYWVGGHWR